MSISKEFIEAIDKRLSQLVIIDSYEFQDLEQLYQLFSLFFEKLTDNASIGFTTLFSRIAYATINHDLPGSLAYGAQNFRRRFEKDRIPDEELAELIGSGIYLIIQIGQVVADHPWNTAVDTPKETTKYAAKRSKFRRSIRACLLRINDQGIEIVDEEQPHIRTVVEITDEQARDFLPQVGKYFQLPLTINLVDVNYENQEKATAALYVLRPDLLLGVTSISECFNHRGMTSLTYLAKKIIPSDSSVHMLIGNVVNYYLDELIHNPDLTFSEVLKTTFKLAPEQFSLMDDQALTTCLTKVETHFNNLKEVVKSELKEAGITKERSYLEPSFYSNQYGLQGRLDLFHHNEKEQTSDIIELKSGKLYQAHAYGLNQNHYIQTLMYDLLLESVFNGKVKSKNYILYSALDEKRLRFAPKVRKKQLAALQLRNKLMLIEELLCRCDIQEGPDLLAKLDPEGIPSDFSFLKRDAEKFWAAYKGLNALEIAYLKNFIAFISREYQLSKIGRHGVYQSNGLASLWLDPMAEKVDRFSILSYLELQENNSDEDTPRLTFTYSDRSATLSRFRVGDLCVLYPFDLSQDSILTNQMFKATILELDQHQVTIRLRARQKNSTIFQTYDYWNIEGDILDNGFRNQFYGLYDWIAASSIYRSRVLGLEPPQKAEARFLSQNDQLTPEQNQMVTKAIAAQDYFLLWGPPGTGKTSIIISELVGYYYKETTQSILLLAYTNRAVDEICAAIEQQVGKDYLRIGSRYSTGAQFQDRLLVTQMEKIVKRSEVKRLFSETRIFVSTIASFQGRREFSKLKQFDLTIIDEASQLLEPMVVGLLSYFRKFIMIGDHKQLPAVVAQNTAEAKVKNTDLSEQIGLVHSGTSLFERLYKNCISNDWTWAYGALTWQGRMHQDILGFVSTEFYDGQLRVLPGLARLTNKPQLKSGSGLQEKLVTERLIFVDTPVDPQMTRKTNRAEAVLVSRILSAWTDIYTLNDLDLHLQSIGVITPFRSQIALIKEQLADQDKFTVDTVERYQGGSRDRIIISLAICEADLLDTITSISDEGIDRKLNVALTRAKEHLIILGSKEVLSRNTCYKRLIEHCYQLDAIELSEEV